MRDLPSLNAAGAVRRRSLLKLLVGAAGTVAFPAFAARFPERPIKIVVPFSSGGTTDLAARLLAELLQRRTGATFVVENKPGAGAAIGIDSVAKAPADGYTLLYGSDALLLGPLTRPNLTFSLADFAPLARVRTSSVYLVGSPGLQASNIKELVALARQKPGQLRYGTGGIATVLHIAGVQFTQQTQTDMVHVPYKGTAPAVTDVVGGHLDLAWAGTVDIAAHVANGAAKVLGMTGEKRSAAMPGVPTMAESGYPGVVVVNWNGMLAPRNTPPETVRWLSDHIAAVAEMPEFLQRGAKLEIEAGAMLKGERFGAFLAQTRDRYAKVIKQADIRLNE